MRGKLNTFFNILITCYSIIQTSFQERSRSTKMKKGNENVNFLQNLWQLTKSTAVIESFTMNMLLVVAPAYLREPKRKYTVFLFSLFVFSTFHINSHSYTSSFMSDNTPESDPCDWAQLPTCTETRLLTYEKTQ